jgi:hypothetical protein
MNRLLTFLLLVIPFCAIGQQTIIVERRSKLIDPDKLDRELLKLRLNNYQNEDILAEFIVDSLGIKGDISVLGLEQIEKYSEIASVIENTQWTIGLQGNKPSNDTVRLFLTILNGGVSRRPQTTPVIVPTEAYSIDEALKSISWSFPKTKLILTSQNIETLSTEIAKIPFIKSLDLENNKLKMLPNEIGELVNLEELYLMKNNINELPVTFENLKSLRILGIANNQLMEVPKQLFNLKKIKVVDLSSNQIERIPIEIGNLKNLEILIIRNNRLTTIPDSIFKLKSLTTLDLGGNRIPLDEIREIESRLKKVKVILE